MQPFSEYIARKSAMIAPGLDVLLLHNLGKLVKTLASSDTLSKDATSEVRSGEKEIN